MLRRSHQPCIGEGLGERYGGPDFSVKVPDDGDLGVHVVHLGVVNEGSAGITVESHAVERSPADVEVFLGPDDDAGNRLLHG